MIITKQIISLTLIINLFAGFIGIPVYNHICGSTGNQKISLLFEQNCTPINDENSCCSIPPVEVADNIHSDCCGSNDNHILQCILEDACCTKISTQLIIETYIIFEKLQLPAFIPPVKIDFDTLIYPLTNELRNLSKLVYLKESITDFGEIVVKYIQSLTSVSSNSDIPLSA